MKQNKWWEICSFSLLDKGKDEKEEHIWAYIQKAGDAGDISPPIFWIFRQILGWARGTH